MLLLLISNPFSSINSTYSRLMIKTLTLVFALSFISSKSQPLFSLNRYKHPMCDPTTVSHYIPLQSYLPSLSGPILVFTSPFNLEVLPHKWPIHSSHSALILLNPDSFDAHHHLDALFKLFRQPHIFVLHTNSTTPQPGVDDDGSNFLAFQSQILSELAVFETETGFILPFYTSTGSISDILNSSEADANNTIPLLNIESVYSMEHNKTGNVSLLKDEVALDFVLKQEYSSQASPSSSSSATIIKNVSLQSTSILDLLKPPQLYCLLSRLQCHTVSSTDPIFNFCISLIRRLPSESFLTQTSLHQFAPLSYYNDTDSLNLSLSSFETMGERVSRAVRLARNQASEEDVRTHLFHSYLYSGLHANHEILKSGWDVNGEFVSLFHKVFKRAPSYCRAIALVLIFVSLIDAIASRTSRRTIAQLVRNCSSKLRFRTAGRARYLSRSMMDRAKLI